MNPTRPATESEQSAPIDRAYLRSPALPTRCGPVEAVPVSAASPSHWERLQAAGRAINHMRQAFGPDSDEYRSAVATAEALGEAYKPLPGNPMLDDDDGEGEAEMERLSMLGLDPWGRVQP